MELDQPADLDDQDIRGIHGHSIKYFLKSVVNYTETGTLLLSLYRNFLAYRKGLIHKERDPTQLEAGVTDSLTRERKSLYSKTTREPLCQATEGTGYRVR